MNLCPVCHSPTLPATIDGDTGQFCSTCWQIVEAEQIPPKEVRGPQRGTCVGEPAFRGKEADLVAQIVKALRAQGRTVLRVGQYRADLAGQTQGTPDLFCWTGTGWVGIECKTVTGRLSPAQKVLAGAGMVLVVRSVAEAIDAVTEEITD